MNRDYEEEPFKSALDLIDASTTAPAPAVVEGNPTTADSRRPYDPGLGKLRSEAQAKVDAARKMMIEGQRKSLPVGLKLTKIGRVTIAGKPGSSAVIDAVIVRILSPTGAVQSQTAIQADIQSAHPSHNVPKDWTVRLPTWAIISLKTRIQGTGAPFSSIRVSNKTTLASLHRAAKNAWQRHQTGNVTFNANIAISDNSLSIGDMTFAITRQKAKGRNYRYARVSIDKLLEQREA
jgi:hypothetical protein